MRIVHVEDYFIPDAGYQINIIPKYQAKQGHEVYIVTSEGEKIFKPNTAFFGFDNIIERDNYFMNLTNVKIIRIKPKINKMISNRIVQSSAFFKAVDELNPDILFVHGNDTLTGIRYLMQYKKLRYPIVMDSHMVEMASRNRFSKIFRIAYKHFITPILVKNKIPVIRTQNSDYLEKAFSIPLSQAPWISVGSDTILFHPDEVARKNLRKKFKIDDNDFLVIYTGKLDSYRGAFLLAKTFNQKFVLKRDRHIVLLTVGSPTDADGEYALELFKSCKNRVINLSTQKYLELAQYYQMADLAVFPKLCSLSIYDAQACGLPVVAEDNEISTDRLKYNNGFTYKADDIEDLREKIIKCAEMNKQDFDILKKNAYELVAKEYDYAEIAEQYTKVLQQEIKRFSGQD